MSPGETRLTATQRAVLAYLAGVDAGKHEPLPVRVNHYNGAVRILRARQLLRPDAQTLDEQNSPHLTDAGRAALAAAATTV